MSNLCVQPSGLTHDSSAPQVVGRICEVPHRTRMLVVDRDTDDYLCSRGLACTEDLALEMGTLLSPMASVTPPVSLRTKHRPHCPAAESPAHLVVQDDAKSLSVASSAASDTEVGGRSRFTWILLDPEISWVYSLRPRVLVDDWTAAGHDCSGFRE